MSDPSQVARDMLQRQIKELDAIAEQTHSDLNTVAGSERIAKWKNKTAPMVAQFIGQKEAQEFTAKRLGPVFTHDVLEEFGDEVDLYRSYLVALAKKIGSAPPAQELR